MPSAKATRGKQRPSVRSLCYLAGVMDSDGCFSISKTKFPDPGRINCRYVMCMNIINTSEDLMKWLVEKFGGRYAQRRKQIRENHKITYDWWFNNRGALWLLKLIEPHLVVKKAQCRNAINLLEHWETPSAGPNGGRGAKLSDAEVARREACYLEMKRLNRLGLVQPQRLSLLAPAKQGDAIV